MKKKILLTEADQLKKILNYLKPTHVHIMLDGKIVKTGHLELIEILEKNGYESFLK